MKRASRFLLILLGVLAPLRDIDAATSDKPNVLLLTVDDLDIDECTANPSEWRPATSRSHG